MDFTVKKYNHLLNAIKNADYSFVTFKEHRESIIESNSYHTPKQVILRHDVDLLPYHSLKFAQIQASKGIKGSYYFRSIPESWSVEVIKQVSELGHEVGYHYETMDTANGDIEKAWGEFRFNLDELRKLVEVKTICMHGSPRSKYDNKAIWDKYDYRSLGVIGEPYYDMDFDDFFYLTDTGRRWDGWKTSVRDKVPQQENWNKEGLVFHSTNDIIQAANQGKLPDKIMMTFHPQRWHDSSLPWLSELILQNAKNVVKRMLVNRRKGETVKRK